VLSIRHPRLAGLTAGLLAAAFLLVSCRDDAPADGTPTATPVGTPEPAAVCLAGQGFRQDGELASFPGDAGPARSVADLRWARHEGCERFVIELAREDGSPVDSVGGVSAEMMRDLGVIRVQLPRDVQTPDETDLGVDGDLVSGAFVVRRQDRGLFVDVHLADAVLARVLRLSNPARIVVDLQPGGPALPQTPSRDTLVVVLEPAEGDATYPLKIVGYARTFEANVLARLRQDGRIVAEEFTTSTDYTEAWGLYSITIQSGPSGNVELFVGELSARDGTEQGVRINLRMR
jgi:hypothetical protein